MKKDTGNNSHAQVDNKTQDKNINVFIKDQVDVYLGLCDDFESFLKNIARAYKEQNLTQSNLLFDLKYVFKEEIFDEYIYTEETYKELLNEYFENITPKQGVFQKNSEQKDKEIERRANRDLRRIEQRDILSREKKRLIADTLTARIIRKFRPRSLSRSNDQRIFYYQNGVYNEDGEAKIMNYLTDRLEEDYAQNVRSLVTEKVRGETFMFGREEKEFFDVKENEICLENGVLNVETLELSSHTPEKVFFEKLPVKYDENAEYDELQSFLRNLVENERDVKTIQEMFGFCLYRKYFLKKAFILLGDANNGKSTVLNILRKMLGDDTVSAVKLQKLSQRFQKRWIVNKLANIVADIPHSTVKDPADFKGLTGQDMMQYEVKGGGAYNFVNYAKLIYSANQLPAVESATPAFFNRWVLIKFPYTFVKREEYDKMKENGEDVSLYKVAKQNVIRRLFERQSMSGVLNFALEGLHRLFERERFTQDDNVRIEWLGKTDSFRAFCLDHIDDAGTNYIFNDHLEDVYQEWCHRHDKTYNSNKSHWKEILKTKYGAAKKRKSINKNRHWVWYGIKFNEESVMNKPYVDDKASFSILKSTDEYDEEDVGYSFDEHGVRQWFSDQDEPVLDEQSFVDEFSEELLDKMKTCGVVHRDSPGRIRI